MTKKTNKQENAKQDASTETSKEVNKKEVAKTSKATSASKTKKNDVEKSAKKAADVAVIASGSHQFIVQVGDILSLEKITYGEDNKVVFNDVLLYSTEKETLIGQPVLEDVSVSADVLNTEKDKKQIGMKFKRKTGYKKIFGHRQTLTTVKITKINKK